MARILKTVKKRWYVVLLVVIAVGFFFFQRSAVTSQTKKEKTYIVKRQTLKETLSLAGEIDAEEKAVLKFQTSGMISWVGVKEGDRVKKYQGIASLDQRELEKNLKKYLYTFVNERMDIDQQRDDYKDKAITDAMQRVVNEAQNDLDSAIVDVELKDIALKYAYLYTPIEGIVTKVDTPYAGVNITPATAEFEVVNPKTVYFSAKADQTEVINFKAGVTGEIVLDSYPEKTLVSKISFISFKPVTGETGTVYELRMKIDEPNDDYVYKLGMTGDASFTIKEKGGVLVIPSSFVKSDNGQKYVLKDENGRKLKTIINVGEEIDGDMEITSGLAEGDKIYD
jgi:RND family efflux transporter MFP subunit